MRPRGAHTSGGFRRRRRRGGGPAHSRGQPHRCSGAMRRRRERLRTDQAGGRIRASDGRAIDDVPIDERLTADLACSSAVVVPDFVVALSTAPDGPTTPHDLAETFRSLAEDGELSIEAVGAGFRVVPLTGMGLYHVGQFLWGRPAGGLQAE